MKVEHNLTDKERDTLYNEVRDSIGSATFIGSAGMTGLNEFVLSQRPI